jgi:gliding motility-associated protein GldM
MNVFYIGVDNPVDVSVPGVPPSKISPFISKGQIVRSGNSWVVRVRETGNVNVGATAELDGQRKNMGSKEFRVKRLPDPVPKVGGLRGGKVDRAWLAAQTGVRADLGQDFLFDLNFPVVGFNLAIVGKGNFIEEARSTGAAFTAQQVQLMRSVQSGKKVYVEDVMAKSPDGSIRNIGSITFTAR